MGSKVSTSPRSMSAVWAKCLPASTTLLTRSAVLLLATKLRRCRSAAVAMRYGSSAVPLPAKSTAVLRFVQASSALTRMTLRSSRSARAEVLPVPAATHQGPVTMLSPANRAAMALLLSVGTGGFLVRSMAVTL